MNPHPPLPNHPTNQPSNCWSLENFAEVGRRWKMELTSERCKNTLPETNKFAPENGCLEDDPFLLGPGLFPGVTANSAAFYLRKFTDLILSLFDFF